jgi:serine/threonine protein phosphatase PrpC
MAVLSGWLLTIANTGDSNAIVDCGDDVQEITFSHRIQVRLKRLVSLGRSHLLVGPFSSRELSCVL